jgi:hypothetical protein
MTTPPELSIVPTQEEDLISLDVVPSLLPEERLQERAAKYNVAMADKGLGIEEIKNLISSGQEINLREAASKQKKIDFMADKLDMVRDMARARGSDPMTPEEFEFVSTLPQEKYVHSETVLEQMYADNLLKSVMNATSASYTKALDEDPDRVNAVHDVARNVLTAREAVQHLVEDEESERSNDGWGTSIMNFMETQVPFLSGVHKMDLTKDGMVGENLQAQYLDLHLLAARDPAEFYETMKLQYQTIKARNPYDALDWLRGYLQYGRTQEAVDNAWAIVDTVDVLAAGSIGVLKAGAKGAAKRAARFGRFKKPIVGDRNVYSSSSLPQLKNLPAGVTFDTSLKAFVKTASSSKTDAADILATAGKIEDSAALNAIREIKATVTPDLEDPNGAAVILHRKVASIYNPRAMFDKGSRLSREAKDRLVEAAIGRSGIILKALHNPSMAMRLTEEALQQGLETAKVRMRQIYTRANDAVVDTKWGIIRQDENAEHVNYVTMVLGQHDATPFKTPEDAIGMADHQYGIQKKDYQVVQDGDGFYIEITRPIDETDVTLRKAMTETIYNQTPRTLANTFLGLLRNPDDLLSTLSRDNRKAITHVSQEIQQLMTEVAKPIGALSKKEKENLSRLMEINRDFQDGVERGKFWDTASEFEQAYLREFHEAPSEREVAAYFTTRQLSDMDWIVRALTIYRDKSRLGLENIEIDLPGVKKFSVDTAPNEEIIPVTQRAWKVRKLERPNETSVGPVVTERSGNVTGDATGSLTGMRINENRGVAKFEGRVVDRLPEDTKHNFGVYILRPNTTKGEYVTGRTMDREMIGKLVHDEGYKIVQLANPADNPFREIDDINEVINFIVVKDARRSRLRVEDMLSYKAGYHVDYAPGFFTKQASFWRTSSGKKIYGGSTSIMYHASEAEARKFHSAFDQARLLLRDKKYDELRAFLPLNLPHSFEQFTQMFHGKGALSLDEPIMWTKSGQDVDDAAKTHHFEHRKRFEDSENIMDSPYNLSSSVNRQYAQEKNLALPGVTRGSEGRPLWDFKKARMIDPLQSLSRSQHSMIRMRAYDNYQYQQLESFIQEFPDVMKWSPETLRANPLIVIKNPSWNDTKVVSKDRLAAAKNVHRALTNLLGVRSDTDLKIDWALNKLVDATFNRGLSDKTQGKVADIALAGMTDPSRYLRGMAFHAKLGLFNPVQYFLQAQSVIHGIAITGNPTTAFQAWSATWLMRRLSLTDNPKIMADFASKATKWGWTKDEFMESFENMKASGLWHVEGEVVQIDDVFNKKLWRDNKLKHAFLDKGPMFFQEGERLVRLNAWNIAYKEWKAKNPGRAIGARERNQILRRYDDLAINMTRSSSAQYQRGVFSLPAQFTSYYVRLMEQMLSKRLSKTEKARLVGMYSAMYGLPTGFAVAAGPIGVAWPWGEDIKQYALEHGIDYNDGINDVLMHGLLAAAIELATGREYNSDTRWGPGGLTFFKEAVTGDKNVAEILLGPSGSILSEMLTSSIPMFKFLVGAFKDDTEAYPWIPEDALAILREASSINQGYKAIYALNLGRFISKNELFTTEADSLDAFMVAVLGLEPRKVSDAYVMIESLHEQKGAQKYAQDQVIKNYRRAMKHAAEGGQVGDEDWMKYMRAVSVWMKAGAFRPDQAAQILRSAIDDSSLIDKVTNQFLLRGPAGSFETRYPQLKEGK